LKGSWAEFRSLPLAKVIGAVGVSGNTPQEDEDIAKAGAAALGNYR
jgi:uncharacterized protein GlcG (DUF336 family)